MLSTRSSASGFTDEDYLAFQKKVAARTGIRLIDYKTNQMKRRIGAMCQQAGCSSFVEYFSTMERNSAILSNFLDNITINVTALLRNPERFSELTQKILPDICKATAGRTLSAWSAGCSYGAEAYTLALLLHEIDPNRTYKITGTDLNLTVLAKANAATFSEADMANIDKERRAKYFFDPGGGNYIPAGALRRVVKFERHDLLSDAYPKAEYDLILCRNVLIYFTEEAKDRIYLGFQQALKPNGILFVGGTERLSDKAASQFEYLMPFFYRKPA